MTPNQLLAICQAAARLALGENGALALPRAMAAIEDAPGTSWTRRTRRRQSARVSGATRPTPAIRVHVTSLAPLNRGPSGATAAHRAEAATRRDTGSPTARFPAWRPATATRNRVKSAKIRPSSVSSPTASRKHVSATLRAAPHVTTTALCIWAASARTTMS
ncbi:hypothetical protein DPMN_179154 [Dreissena polymorpha]|uniref:Uncharacterized protein n=1 Tax=Dreissena polymorpha TaxID=45954 RepID=A0A9D4EDG0_DREPO|nr:hypothetical protein DPMN_179154 [Dreissena polymorpha]